MPRGDEKRDSEPCERELADSETGPVQLGGQSGDTHGADAGAAYDHRGRPERQQLVPVG